MTAILRVGPLLALWLLAWGEVSPANVLSGVVLSALLLLAFPPKHGSTDTFRFAPMGVVRLGLYIAKELVTANVLVARVILSRHREVRTGVIAYEVAVPNDWTITLISNVIALTPGTMTVEATRDPGVLYVHFLMLDDADEARARVAHLERLAVAALGVPLPKEDPA